MGAFKSTNKVLFIKTLSKADYRLIITQESCVWQCFSKTYMKDKHIIFN